MGTEGGGDWSWKGAGTKGVGTGGGCRQELGLKGGD